MSGRQLLAVTVLALLASLVVVGWAVAAKLRIDARSHVLAARSLLGDDPATATSSTLVEAGESLVLALRCHLPTDPSGPEAVRSLLRVVGDLRTRGAAGDARRLVGEALGALECCSFLYVPLPAERAELRRDLATPGAPAEAGSGPPER